MDLSASQPPPRLPLVLKKRPKDTINSIGLLSVNVAADWIFALCSFQMEMFVSTDTADLSPGAAININLCL